MNRELRVLIVSPRQCWPARSGAKLRDYYIAQALGNRAQLTYMYYGDAHAEPIAAEHLPFAQTIVRVPRPGMYSPLKVIRGLLSEWPLTAVNYHSSAMTRALNSVLRGGFDLIQFDATQLALFVPQVRRLCPDAQIVFDWHNVESELLHRYAASSASLLRRIYARVTARKMESLERKLLQSDAWHLVCSEREQAQLKAIAPDSHVAAIGNGVDASFYSPSAGSADAASEKTRLLFVGLMSYHANVEAATWFSRQIWPEIHANYPSLTLTLAGADPAPAVVELRNLPGVEVTGTVADLRPLYRQAFCAIVPLHTGAGTRLKILEAMAAGVPVISTAIGAEGLAVSPKTDILIAREPADWLAHLQLLTREPERKSLIAKALTLVMAKYDWARIGTSLSECYDLWFDEAQTRAISASRQARSFPLLLEP